MTINDPGNAATASRTPPRAPAPVADQDKVMRRQKANAAAFGILFGLAVLGGGLGTIILDSWKPAVVAAVLMAGSYIVMTGINTARFGIGKRPPK